MDRSLGLSILRRWLVAAGLGLVAVGTTAFASSEPCGTGTYPFPYTDVASVGDPFCPGIMEAYVTGVSQGTTGTTFSPNDNVSRLQMTTFLRRSLDQGLTRASRRTVLKQLWQTNANPQEIAVSGSPVFCAADGENIWVASQGSVSKVEASTGTVLGTWTGFTKAWPIMAIPGLIVTADNAAPNGLYFIDPTMPPGPIGPPNDTLLGGASSIAYDGANVWIANFSGTVTIIGGGGLANFGGFSHPVGLVYDGAQMWVTDYGLGSLVPVAPDGTIGTAIPVGAGPEQPAFDGQNIWVPNSLDSSISVVSVKSRQVIATIVTDGINKLSDPEQASFDGERILVTNHGGFSMTLFKAADLSVIGYDGSFGGQPYGVCSDGSHFWITFTSGGILARF